MNGWVLTINHGFVAHGATFEAVAAVAMEREGLTPEGLERLMRFDNYVQIEEATPALIAAFERQGYDAVDLHMREDGVWDVGAGEDA